MSEVLFITKDTDVTLALTLKQQISFSCITVFFFVAEKKAIFLYVENTHELKKITLYFLPKAILRSAYSITIKY